MCRFFSLANITAGFIAVLIGFTSSAVIIFQAAAVAGATEAEVSSWLLALGLGMGLSSIGLSLYYRVPILIAWSTPGAALLVTSLSGASLAEATGAFIVSALLILLSGLTGWFEKIISRVPASLVSAMLAGILLKFTMNAFLAMQEQFLLVFTMFLVYLLSKSLVPRYAILLVLLAGTLIAVETGLFHVEQLHFTLSKPVFTQPVFSLHVIMGIALPLFIVTMTSQNIPGVAVLHAAGYKPPISPLISWTGFANLLLAPFGGYAFNLAAITAAICLGKEADNEPTTRYRAAVWAGVFYLITGFLGASIVSLFSAFPQALIVALAGLALFGTIGSSLKVALDEEKQREAALIALLVTASGLSLFGIGSAFWGLVAGVLSLIILNWNRGEIVSLTKPEAAPANS